MGKKTNEMKKHDIQALFHKKTFPNEIFENRPVCSCVTNFCSVFSGGGISRKRKRRKEALSHFTANDPPNSNSKNRRSSVSELAHLAMSGSFLDAWKSNFFFLQVNRAFSFNKKPTCSQLKRAVSMPPPSMPLSHSFQMPKRGKN